MLAIVNFVQMWRPYLWGTKFKVYTDHSPLRQIKTGKNYPKRLTSMILKLQEYDFDLYYTLGQENVVADALSRVPIASKEEKEKGELSAITAPEIQKGGMENQIQNCEPIKESSNIKLINLNNKEILYNSMANGDGTKEPLKRI